MRDGELEEVRKIRGEGVWEARRGEVLGILGWGGSENEGRECRGKES